MQLALPQDIDLDLLISIEQLPREERPYLQLPLPEYPSIPMSKPEEKSTIIVIELFE